MNDETYLPLSYLNAWEYCHRRFYLEFVLGEFEHNEHTITGTHVHRHIDKETTRREGDTTIHQQQWVWSDRLLISGVIDAVEETHGILVPIEYKKGRMGKYLSDHFQLCGAALCLEERLGKSIEYGEIFYHTNRRRERVIFTDQLRQATEAAIQAARIAGEFPIPAPINHPKKCQACSLQHICLPNEVRLLSTVASC